MPYFDTPSPESRVYARVEELNGEVETLEAELATLRAKAEAMDRLDGLLRKYRKLSIYNECDTASHIEVWGGYDDGATLTVLISQGPSLLEAINALPGDEPAKEPE